MKNLPLRSIRSFVLRQGRITPSQKQAFYQDWPQFGIDLPSEENMTLLNWENLFPTAAPVIMEIGFGMGDHLIHIAEHTPEKNFIGIEVHQPGIGRCIAKAKSLGLTNLKIVAYDAVVVLNKMIPDASLDRILLLFPDPWPKKRHHKRRIVQPEFVDLISQKLIPNGIFHVATDWEAYADHILSVLENCPLLQNTAGCHQFATNISRLTTKFELRGKKLGHPIRDLIYSRC